MEEYLHLGAYLLQGSSVILGVIIAANTKTKFLDDNVALAFASAAAFFTFVNGFIKAESKAAAFETAARELERAFSDYQVDLTLAPKFLADADKRGIDILNRLKSG